MGRRGPLAQPYALKLLRGTARGGPPSAPASPTSGPGLPACPAWLDPEAKAEWRRVAPELRRAGLLTAVDRTALAGYCQAVSRWRQAEEALAEGGLTSVGARGVVRARPEISLAHKFLGELLALARELGLTPASRRRLLGSDPEGPSRDPELEALLD